MIRNSGRNGARFAPASLLATFKRLTQTSSFKDQLLLEIEVASVEEEERNFHQAQEQESQRIRSILREHPAARIVHIGGGHDHIYPLLLAYAGTYKEILVINIDAHADTRTDESFHSGTPFRQFADGFKGRFELFQVGLNRFANSSTTLEPLTRGEHRILWRKEMSAARLDAFFEEMKKSVMTETLVVFSLDADAIDAAHVPGVSAVNPEGLSMAEVQDLWKRYLELGFKHPPVMGVYELNPVYDTLAGLSMRTIAGVVFEGLRGSERELC
ncbi:MAG TPA: arginase family protein [Bacteriovoracaceae bacterium]|nr:arginase family protein [Bacteriovoracaceae bacterium]